MRALSVTSTLLLALVGITSCASNPKLYQRSEPARAQAPQSDPFANDPTIPSPQAQAPESAADGADQSAANARLATESVVPPSPPLTGSAVNEERAATAPAEQAADQGAADRHWLDLVENDVDKAVAESRERRRIHFSKEVIDHPRVRYFIEHYTNNAKHDFKELLTRSGKYMPMIAKVLNEEGLPQELGYLALIESAFVVNSASPSGAVGLWQMIASTARKYGLRVDRWVDERRDPVKSTRAAAAYLKDLHDYYGRWFLATAAYNAGPGNIDKALRQSDAEDFWTIRAKAKLSDETRDFVPKFVAISLIATDPHSYGFQEIRYQPPMDYEEVEVRGAMRLSTLAQLSDTAVSEIRRLNPSLLRDSTPPDKKSYRIKLSTDKAAIFVARNEKRPSGRDQQPGTVTHVVKRGETLSSIARFYGLTVRALMSINGLTNSRIRIGQKLSIALATLQRALH